MLVSFALLCVAFAKIPGDLVQLLPPFNLTQFNFSIFSGMLQIASGNQSFHYVFVESQLDVSDQSVPLIIWLNGGPGCSSMMGLFEEIGPFVFPNDTATMLEVNPWSWNRVGHLLFLESPSGVGYSKNPSRLVFNDSQVAKDNLAVLQEFFSNFPNFQKNPLWISGESYAGAYIPMLAVEIENFNAQGVALINLQGLLIGNGVTNLTELETSEYEYLQQHHIIPPNLDVYQCQKNDRSKECYQLRNEVQRITKFVNPYDIYGYCWYANQEIKMHRHFMGPFIDVFKDLEKAVSNEELRIPCTQLGTIQRYMNDPVVKANLHVDPEQCWYLCQLESNFKYVSEPTAALSALKTLLLKNSYQILLFNGDSDSVVPWIDTLKCRDYENASTAEAGLGDHRRVATLLREGPPAGGIHASICGEAEIHDNQRGRPHGGCG